MSIITFAMTDYRQARNNMVLGQLLPSKVFSKSILKIMARIPREDFAPRSVSHLCYADKTVEVLKNRYLLAPMVFARLIQEANIRKEDKILDIGFGTGYSSILLGFLCGRVISLESDKSLVSRLKNTLLDYEVLNVYPVCNSLQKGWPAEAPYDVIFIGGTVQDIPSTLEEQVKEGGRIVTMKDQGASDLPHALVMTRKGDTWTTRCAFEAASPCLKEFIKAESFAL